MNHKLHLFFPENDLALAAASAGYTPPEAALNLHRAGEALPLWYGEPGDSFISSGINDRWLTEIERLFDPQVTLYAHNPAGLVPAPWGWSKASRRYYADAGFAKDTLPDDKALERIRELSHRRTAAAISRRLADVLPFPTGIPASEIKNVAELEPLIAEHGELLLKSPWSSSGRGLMRAGKETAEADLRRIEGVIRHQGSIMAEKYYADKLADFAMLFEMDADGGCGFAGLSLFSTAPNGAYTGNILASDAMIADRLAAMYDSEKLNSVRDALPRILTEVIGNAYVGPLGVDMMLVRNEHKETEIVAAVELNLRMTMGHVARRFYDRFCNEGAEGLFKVAPMTPGSTTTPAAPETSAAPVVENHRLVSGTLSLTPPPGKFSFTATIN